MSETEISKKTKEGEKQLGGAFSFHRFLETHQSFTYSVRALTENNFIVKKKAVKRELPLRGWVLDIACGGGFLLDVIPDRRKYLGVDMSEEVIRHAKAHYDGAFMRMDARRMAFQDNTFDSCIAMDIFHHIRDEDADPILKDIERILTTDGRLLVTDPFKANFFTDPISKAMQILDRGDCFRTTDELGALLAKRFKIEKHYTERSGISKWQIFVLSKR